MADVAAILERLDRALTELQAIRAELGTIVPSNPPAVADLHKLVEMSDTHDLADGNLLDTTSAAARFGYPRDTIAGWCRQGDGVKVGGRWMADVHKLRQRINGRG